MVMQAIKTSRVSVLVDHLDLPASMIWFNQLNTRERNEFLRGLMIVLSSPESERQRAVNSHLRHWEIAAGIATRQGKPVGEVIKGYHPRPARTPLELFAEAGRELRTFEAKYSMSSVEFDTRFQRGEIQEGPWDYFVWRARYGSYLYMQERYGFSEKDLAA